MNIFIENLSNILKIYNSERRELIRTHLGSRIAKDSRVPTTEVFNKALNTVKQKCFHSIYYLYHNNYGKINFSKPIQLTYEYNDITFDYVEEYNTLLVEAIINCIIDIFKIIYELRGFTILQLFSKIVKRYNLYIADRNKINDDNISKNAKKQYIYYIEVNKYNKKQIPIKQTILKQIIDIKENPDNFIRENYSAKEYLKLFELFFERDYSHKGVFSGITYINFSDIISSETDIEIQNYYNNDILECYLYIYINIFEFDFNDDNVYVKFYDNINEKIENHYYYNTNIIKLSNNIKKNTRSLSLLFKQLINSNTITLNDKRMFNDPYLKVLDDINSNLLYTRSLDSYNKSIIEKLFTKLDYIYNFLLSEEYINIPDKSKIDDNFTEDRIQEYLYNGLYFFQIRMYLFDIYKSAPDTISEQICITLERFYYLLYLENLKNFDSYIQTAEKSITQKVNISSVYNRGKPEKPKETEETEEQIYERQAATSEVKSEETPYVRQAATSEVKSEETRRPTLVKLAPIAPTKKMKLTFYLFQLACDKKKILNNNSLLIFFNSAPESLNLAPLTNDRTVLYIKAHIMFKIQYKYDINSFNISKLIKDKNIIYYLDLNNNRKKELYRFANYIKISVKNSAINKNLIDFILNYIYMTFDNESSVSSKLNRIFGVDNFNNMINIINNPDSDLTEINNKIKDLLYEINAINDRNIQSNSFLINKIYTKNISNNQEIISLLFEIFRDNPNKYEDILNELFRIFKIDFSDNIDRKIDELNNKLQTPITENKDEIISDLKKMIPKNYILFSYEDYSTTSKFYYDKLNKELLIILLKKIKEIDVNNIFKSIYDSYNRIYLYISYKNNNDTEWSYKNYYDLSITPFKYSDYYQFYLKTPIIIKEQKLNTDIIRIDELIKLSKNSNFNMNILNECKIMFLNLVLFYNLLVFLGKTYGFYNSSITFNNLLYDRNKGTLLFFTLDSVRFTKKDILNQTLSNIDNIIKENSFSIHNKNDLTDITYDTVFSDIIKTANKDYYVIFDLINLASLFKIPFLVHLLLSFKYSGFISDINKVNLIFFINIFNDIFKLFNFTVPPILIQSEDTNIDDTNIDDTIDKLLIDTYIFTNISSIQSNLDGKLNTYNKLYDKIISHNSEDYMKTTLITLLEGLLLEYLFNIFKGKDNDKEDFIEFLKSDVIENIGNGNHSILCIFRDSNCINLTTRGGSKKKKRGGTLIPINGISGIIDDYLKEIKKEYLESKYITGKTKQDTNKLIEIYKRIIE